ncbi:MAG: hypothetical protein ABI325_02610 [Ginsengibacter sp.]
MFISFERSEVLNFRNGIEHFKQDIQKVTETIRSNAFDAEKTNPEYIKAAEGFFKLCHKMEFENVREMMIQHILTEDIFNTIFDEHNFTGTIILCRELESVINTFFKGNTRRAALSIP